MVGLLPGSAHLNLGYDDSSCVLDIAKYVLTYLGVTRDPPPGDAINAVKESDSGLLLNSHLENALSVLQRHTPES